MNKEGLTPIPVMFRTFYDTKANLDLLAGLLDGELAWATDELKLYRQDGDGAANWVDISPTGFATYYDTKANLDGLTGLVDGEIAWGTDDLTLYRQDGDGAANWVSISATPVVIATGTYTGNDVNGRQIAVGFKCSLVIIASADTSNNNILIPLRTIHHFTGNHSDVTAQCYLHATDGFITDAAFSNTNDNAIVYEYWAISE